MNKIVKGNKEAKKQPLMTPKEKKQAKRARKHPSEIAALAHH